jgi:serine protease Do
MKLKLLNLKSAAVALCLAALPLGAQNKSPQFELSNEPVDREARLSASFSPIIKRAAPSVVNIYSTRKSRAQGWLHPFLEDPTIRRFFGDPDGGSAPTRKVQSLGSGVIVTEDGYILSNNHVVEGADEVKVVLQDGKTEYDAKVVGRDPQTDVAVLKVEGGILKPITIADSDKLEVGDVVLAIGNPFGVGQTVTHGIISALGRGGFGITDYEDFIQTDAAINPGNSGGALVDSSGRLIGISQSILSRSGTASGVAFAIPINLARSVMERLVTDGRVARGFLGVGLQPMSPDLAREFNLPNANGALITMVQTDSPAAEAGLREGDVVTEYNGKPVNDDRHFRLAVSQTAPKSKVALKAYRDGKTKSFTATLGSRPDDFSVGMNAEESPAAKELQGIQLGEIDPRTRRQYQIPREINGALVTAVEANSRAAELGIAPGNVIVEVNRTPVETPDEVRDAAMKSRNGRLLVRVWSGDGGGNSGSRYLLLR